VQSTEDDTIATMQLVDLYQDKYKTIRSSHLPATAPATAPTTTTTTTTIATSTTTVRRTLSSIPPSLAPSYSTTTINGEFILLFRSAYQVNRIY
jgi:hypothetical protein